MYTIFDFIKNSAEVCPQKEAIRYQNGETFSYLYMYNSTLFLSKYLKSIGIKKGDRVGIFLPNSFEHAICIFSLAKIGAVFVSINISSVETQVEHIINNCNVKLLILQSITYITFSKWARERPSEFFITVGYIRGLVCLKDILLVGEPDIEKDAIIDSDLASIIYTSGSTGKPKGIMIIHRNLVSGTKIVCDYLEIDKNDRILAILPFNFDYGLNQLLTCFYMGATLVIKWPFTIYEIPFLLESQEITGFAGIPTIWIQLLNQRSINKYNFKNLKYLTNSGGKIPDIILDKLAEHFKHSKVYLMYGLTEAFRCTYLPPSEFFSKKGSIGKAIPNTEVFIVNENNKICMPFEIGELVCRSSCVALGYWGDKDATDSVFKVNPFSLNETLESEKVVYSGDLVYMDEDGYLFYTGRKNDMIKSHGYRISPSEIEDVLYSYEIINECAVIGVEDITLGERIIAFLNFKQSNDILDLEALKGFCLIKLPTYMVPHEFIVIEQLPRTSTGKIDRNFLKKDYYERTASNSEK